MDNSPEIRLNKFLAERLGVSRREADELIASGQITVNGHPAALGTRISCPCPLSSEARKDGVRPKRAERSFDKNNKVCYNGKIVPLKTDFLYIAFNKPVGYVCSRRAQGPAPTLYDLLPADYHKLKTVGRLDKDSSGLILLTNDGDFAFSMTHPKFHKEKVYQVELDRDLEPLHQQMISDFGIEIGDGKSKFAVIRDEVFNDRKHFTVVLSEGRNRQIRRTFAALGYMVKKLHRTTFGKYELGNLPSGKYDIIEP